MTPSPCRLLPLLCLLLLALSAGGCTSLAEDSRTCPCAAGWTCCDGRCVPGGSEACPAPLPAPPDTLPPEAPRLETAAPASPTSAAAVTLTGSAEPLSQVRLHAQADCAGAPVAEASADAAGAFTLGAAPAPEATTSFSARATDAAGNASACSAPLAVTHDSRPPEAPVLESLSPGALSRTQTQPLLTGRAEPLARVGLYTDAACTQAHGPEVQADAAGHFLARAQVAPNSRVHLFARAVDAAGNVSACSAEGLAFEHDDRAPEAPALTAVLPPSPSRTQQVQWTGTGEPGARVHLFRDVGCTQPEGSVREVDAAGTWTHAFLAMANATTQYTARALDAAGNESACVALAAFVHDSRPPATPSFGYPGVVSPGNTPTPQVSGTAESEARVRIYDSALCGAAQLRAETVADRSGSFATSVAVSAPVNRFYARAVDAAGNVSACTDWGIEYLYDTTPPLPPEGLVLTEPSPLREAPLGLAAVGRAEPRSRVELFSGPSCTAPVLGTVQLGWPGSSENPLPLPFYLELPAALAAPWEALFAQTTDVAGNPSACVPVPPQLQPATPGAPAWGVPEQPPAPGLAHLALDAAGRLYAAGSAQGADGALRLAVHRRDLAAPGAPWEELALPATFTPSTSLSVNARGDLLLVGSTGSGGTWAARFDAALARWQEPQSLGTPGRTGTGAVSAVLDAAGGSAACWREQVPAGEPEAGAFALRCSRAAPGLGAWEPPATLSTEPTDYLPPLLPDAGGGLRALLYRRTGTPGSWSVRARRWAPGEAEWGAEETLVPAVGGAGASVADPAGAATLAYVVPVPEGGEAVFVRRAAAGGGAWEPPTRVSEPREGTGGTKLAAGVAGEVVLGWYDSSGPGLEQSYLRHFREGEGWDAPQRRPPPASLWAGNTQLLSAGPGRAWVVWSESLSGVLNSRSVDVLLAERSERGVGLGPRLGLLHDPANGWLGPNSRAAADAQGRLAASADFTGGGQTHDVRLSLLRVLQ